MRTAEVGASTYLQPLGEDLSLLIRLKELFAEPIGRLCDLHLTGHRLPLASSPGGPAQRGDRGKSLWRRPG